ncbi:TAR DNA-binding protein 43 [Tetranychus urticae]|uniref:RRM domain-containing protein n=1 Tax=Tetranychus urticae TaxID=32264 RepID=T1JTM1_TETUR|nr:TAR DNA-binding protein 43 [Tetranychus urticae]XP_015789565.1 TAR DNA-binding protein 43 [Tetranychus urticae]
MACYVQVCENETSEPIELPIQEDGTMLLTTLTSQFPGASGLRYRNEETGTMRAVSLVENKFQAPDKGWSKISVYYVVFPKGDNKRKSDDVSDEESSVRKKPTKCTDLIVLGLPWKTTETELREYFEQFGELLMAQVKKDPETGLSKGFGFIRFGDYDTQKQVIQKRHNIGGRWCDVRIPLSKGDAYSTEYDRKIFVGRLTEDITTEDLREYFSKFGDITDVFIPRPFRAFAFVTYESEVSQNICGDHIVKGVSLHVSNAVPKSEMSSNRFSVNNHFSPYGPGNQMSKISHGGMPPMSNPTSRYSHQPYYSSYAARRATYGSQPLPRRLD